MIKKDISKEDIEVWNNYIKDPQDIVDKDVLSQKKINQSKQDTSLIYMDTLCLKLIIKLKI